MSEHKRKYLSGSQKRKLKEQKEIELAKCQKLSSFFSCIPSTSASQNDFESHTKNSVRNAKENLETDKEEYKKREEINEYIGQIITEKSTEDETHNIIGKIENFDKYKDLALWPDSINREFINNCLSKEASFFQNRKQDNFYFDSNKFYKGQKRQFNNKYFEKRLRNGQKLILRSLLCYSNSKGCVYCLVYKIFSISQTSLGTTGYSDWANLIRTLDNHEESIDHKNSMLIWLTRKEHRTIIDRQFEKQIRNESEYYYNVLMRVVAIIKFLSERGLPLRGHDEKWGSPHNGNFMELVELIAEFDPFL